MKNKLTKRNAHVFAAIVFLISLLLFFVAYKSPTGSNERAIFMMIGAFVFGIGVTALFFAKGLITHEDRSIHRQEHTLRKADGECDILHRELH